MRTTLLYAIVGLFGAGLVNLFLGGRELTRFVREVKTIASTHEMERFKQLAARQMYAALAQIAFLGLPALIYFGGLTMGVLAPADIGYIILPSLGMIVLGFVFKKTETQVQQTPAADEALATERDAVVATWLKKAVPDW